MKAYTIKPHLKSVEELDITIEANTVYSFFNSILVDELPIITKHVVYSDANALSEGKEPFFIGENLVIGDALILGKEMFEDVEATIPQKDLEMLISYEVSEFYKEVLKLLAKTEVNLYRTFDAQKNGETLKLNIEWVLYTFNIADDKTKQYFLTELEKSLDSTKNVEKYMQKMAQLALNVAQ